MPDAVPFSLPFDEAIEHFQRKGYEISPDSWRDVWQDANARSFTVARVTAMDVLVDIKAEVARALADGVSLDEFKKNLGPRLEARGWLAPKGEAARVELPDGTVRKRLTPWRLETIWRTNIQTAYSAGRYKQMTDPDVAEARPYWQYKAIMDKRTRPNHAAMNNRVYDHRHPIWDTWYPPNGFHCRCYIKTLSADDVTERGLTPEVDPPGAFQPDEGWRYNPGQSGLNAGWMPDLGRYPALVKQNFLEDLLDQTCPDDWADFVESRCFKRLKKQLTQKDLEDMQTLVWARMAGGVEGYADWAVEVLRRGTAQGEIYPVGNIPLRVLSGLEKQPRLALVVAEDSSLLHLYHDKTPSGRLSIDEIAGISSRFGDAEWYFDTRDPALLMTWIRHGDRWVKIVIRMDRKVGRGVANRITTAGVVKDEDIERSGRYKKL